MQARPGSDPRSWQYWANVHGTPAAQNAAGTWKRCQHGSFSSCPGTGCICSTSRRCCARRLVTRTLHCPTGDGPSTAECRCRSARQRLPRTSSTLRAQTAAPALMPAGSYRRLDVSFATAFSFTNFAAPTGGLSFGGRTVSGCRAFRSGARPTRGGPHDVIHDDIGAGGWMSDPDQAARDPISICPPLQHRPPLEAVARLGRRTRQPNRQCDLDESDVPVLRSRREWGRQRAGQETSSIRCRSSITATTMIPCRGSGRGCPRPGSGRGAVRLR